MRVRAAPVPKRAVLTPGLSPAKHRRAEGSRQGSRCLPQGPSAELFCFPGEAANKRVPNQPDTSHPLVQTSLLPLLPQDEMWQQHAAPSLGTERCRRAVTGTGSRCLAEINHQGEEPPPSVQDSAVPGCEDTQRHESPGLHFHWASSRLHPKQQPEPDLKFGR